MRTISKRHGDVQEIHEKTWGHEVWIENIPEYCGKLLVFRKDHGCSMHFHKNKKETMYLQSGRIRVELIEPDTAKQYEIVLNPGDSLLIPPAQLHRLFAEENSELFEFSTTHEDEDSYRAWR